MSQVETTTVVKVWNNHSISGWYLFQKTLHNLHVGKKCGVRIPNQRMALQNKICKNSS